MAGIAGMVVLVVGAAVVVVVLVTAAATVVVVTAATVELVEAAVVDEDGSAASSVLVVRLDASSDVIERWSASQPVAATKTIAVVARNRDQCTATSPTVSHVAPKDGRSPSEEAPSCQGILPPICAVMGGWVSFRRPVFYDGGSPR
jgi:hypothetical protein